MKLLRIFCFQLSPVNRTLCQLFDSWRPFVHCFLCVLFLTLQISLRDGELEVGAGHVWGVSRFLRATVPIVQGDKCDCLFVGFAGLRHACLMRHL
jgi:hypothetical protein